MIQLALRNLAARKLRVALTSLAILTGVAMISATYVYIDSVNSGFDRIFKQATKGTDVIVTGREPLNVDHSHSPGLPEPLPQSYVKRVSAVPGVAAASPAIADSAQVIKRNGKPVLETGGPPTLAFSVERKVADRERFDPLSLVGGHFPSSNDQVALDKDTAEKAGVKVGERVKVTTRGPAKSYTVSGITKFGKGKGTLGGATITVFTFAEAQRVFKKAGKVDTISVAGIPGISQGELAKRLRSALPPAAIVKTGKQSTDEQIKDVTSFLSVIQTALLVFAGVAIFVGAFIIFNTFSITVAQRAREFGLLRTIGASRRQLMVTVVVEALLIGLLASIMGLFAGLGLANGISAMFKEGGVDLPQTALTFRPRTVSVSLAAGILVTLIASITPARRATRISPIAALQEGFATASKKSHRLRHGAAAFLTIAGTASILVAVLIKVGGAGKTLTLLGIGSGAILLGVTAISPLLMRPIAAFVGWPGEHLSRITGRLARENSVRNPGRTAITASALMIGLALITFVATFAGGLTKAADRTLERLYRGDYLIQNRDGFSPIPGDVQTALRKVSGVDTVAGIRQQGVKLGSRGVTASGVDQRLLPRSYGFDWKQGSNKSLRDLGSNGAVIDRPLAEKLHLQVGEGFKAKVQSGRIVPFTVAGIFEDNMLFKNGFIVTQTRFNRLFTGSDLQSAIVTVAKNRSRAQVKREIDNALKAFPTAESLSLNGFKQKIKDQTRQILNLLYALLGISVIVSLFGIVNTLTLSIYERTREIGMTRAIGMTPRQVRSVIRQESVITAAAGALLGVAVGVLFSWLISLGMKEGDFIFTVPIGALIAFLAVGLAAGIVSAVFPARRAARINVLAAIAEE